MTRLWLCLAPVLLALPSAAAVAQTPDPATSQSAARPTAMVPDERYRLHAGDQLGIEYTYTPDYNETPIIQPDGFVTLRVGHDVQVAGKTVSEAKALIEASAAERLEHPIVSLTLLDFQKPYFIVAGEATTPLKYDLREHFTVLQAIMLSGGIKQTGKEKEVILIHGVGTPHPEVHVLDLKHVEKNDIFAHDMALSSGDIVFIPRNKITRAIQVMSLINSPVGYANTITYATGH